MVKEENNSARDNALNPLVLAALLVIVASIYFHQIQALLPLAALLLALRIYLTGSDPNIRRLSGVMSFYFGASSLSNVAWYLIPAVFDGYYTFSAEYYYISGMFWLCGYAAIAYVLLQMKNSMQWYIDRELDRLITAMAVIGFFLVVLLVFLNMPWGSPNLIDILLLLVYLCFDAIILMLTLKMLNMNLQRELRALANAMLLFFGFNALADLLFECRWLFSLKSMMSFNIVGMQWSLNIRNTTDLIYEVSLLIMTGCLFLYLIDPFRSKALDDTRRRLKNTRLFVDDLVAKSPDATCIIGRDGHLLLVNDSFLRTFGLERSALSHSCNLFSYLGQIVPDEQVARQIATVLEGETVIVPKLKIPGIRTGRQGDFYINLKMFPTFGSTGRIINYVMIIEDITDRILAEEAVRESEEKYRSLVENINDMIWEIDAEGKCTYASPKARDVLGYEPGHLLGNTPFHYIVPRDAGRVRELVEPLLSRHEPFGLIEYTVARSDGTLVTIETSGIPMFDSNGRYTGYRGVNRDTTERKKAEAALRESEEKFRVLAETAPVAICIMQDGWFKYANPAMETISGYSHEELLTQNFMGMVHPDASKFIEARYGEWLGSEGSGEFRSVLKGVRKDGKVCWIDLSRKGIDYQGRPALLLTGIDITERVLAGEALRESEEKFRVLAETAPVAIIIRQGERLVYVNNAAEQMTGYTRDELLAMKPMAFLHPDNSKSIEDKFSRGMQGVALEEPGDVKIATRDGRELWVSVSMTPTTYLKNPAWMSICMDITERVRLEKDLYDAYQTLKEEYERRTDFTNAAAHELRTPLTPIIGYTDILKSEVTDERHRKYLEIIERNAIRQKDMVNRMLELASLDAGMAHVNSSEFMVLPLVTEVADNYRTVHPDIRVDVPPGLRMTTDADVVRHILDNLVSNAVKYSSNGAPIAIKVTDDDEAGCYRFSVSDHGAGIPREEWDRIFERFYLVGGDRDNRTSGRVGLGLALVKAYVGLIGGTVWLDSEPGRGSTFFFTVPKAGQPAGQPANV